MTTNNVACRADVFTGKTVNVMTITCKQTVRFWGCFSEGLGIESAW